MKDLAATQSPAARVESRVDEQPSSSAMRKHEDVTPQMAPLYAVDPREVRARLDTPRVRNLLAVGYTVAELTVAIEQRLRTCGKYAVYELGNVILATFIYLNCASVHLLFLIKNENRVVNFREQVTTSQASMTL